MRSELFESMQNLQLVYSKYTPCFEPKNAEPREVKKFREYITKKVDCFTPLKPNMDLNELYKIAVEHYNSNDTDFSSREQNNLPFILFRQNNSEKFLRFLLGQCIDFERESRLYKLIYVYFANYTDSNYFNALRNFCFYYFRDKEGYNFRRKVLQLACKNYRMLFGYETEKQATKLLNEIGLNKMLESLGIAGSVIATSNFVQQMLSAYFVSESEPDAKLKVFSELLKVNFKGYSIIQPKAVSTVIRIVEKYNKADWKKFLLSYCIQEFKDPRINSGKWIQVGDDSRKIFLKWLAQQDLDLFFAIIDETALDRMWKYRKQFWKAYIPYVTNTWIFLGPQAKNVAENIERRQSKTSLLAYGDVVGGDNKHSALIFELGGYIFCEWSHNGRLYIWNENSDAVKKKIVEFGSYQINKSYVTRSDYMEAFTHYSTDKCMFFDKNSWQKDVSEWIKEHCGISKTRHDWGMY